MAYSAPDIQLFKPGIAAEYLNHPFPNPELLPPKPITCSPAPDLPNTTLSSFHLFPRLPIELRVKIWHLVLPGPRIVKVHPFAISERKRMVNKISHKKAEFLFSSPSKPPILLSVCRESREEALRFYHLSFGFDHVMLHSTIYFNGQVDVLYFEFTDARFYSNLGYFTSSILGEGCTRLDMDRVECIALSHRLVAGRPNALAKMIRRLLLFKNLKELIIAVERGEKGEKCPVGNDAFLEEVGGVDEALRRLIAEVEQARVIWEGDDAKSWKDSARRIGVGDRKVPNLKVMEVVNRETTHETVLPVRARKGRLELLGDIFKRRLHR